MVTDPVADMLTRLRNALLLKKKEVVLPYSKLKHSLAVLLQSRGWLEKVETAEENNKPKFLKLRLRYESSGEAAISGLKRLSRPGQRIYARYSELSRYRLGVGATIISTSRGLMTDREAREAKVGGEVICQIW